MTEKTGDELLMQYFHEIPNKDAAIAAAVLYSIITIVVAAITIKTRAWFMMTVAVTGFLETFGFALRASMIADPVRMKYIIMQCLLIISPVLLAIVEYICVGKLLRRSEAGRNSAFTKWIARLFTASDIVCLMLQGAGGGLVAGDNVDSVKMGEKLLLAGLYAQLGFFGLFVFVVIYVQRTEKFGFVGNKKMRPLFICLYLTITLMYIRNIFRVVEFMQGWDGYLATHEAYFYGFDFAPLYSCFLCFSFLHYGFFLGSGFQVYPCWKVDNPAEAGDVRLPPMTESVVVIPPSPSKGSRDMMVPKVADTSGNADERC